MRSGIVLALVLLTASAEAAAPAADKVFASAAESESNNDFTKARELYRVASENDPDPRQRDLATIRLAKIEWRIFQDAAAAEKDLARIAEDGESAGAAWIERARIAAEIRGDFAAAREAAAHAVAIAKRPFDRVRASYRLGLYNVEPVRRARFVGRCSDDAALVTKAKQVFEPLIRENGPAPNVARQELEAALIANDGPAALAAWRGYYGVTAQSSILAPQAKDLGALLPVWKGVEATPADRRAVGLALARSRFFDAAALVLADPCAAKAVERDAEVSDVLAYAETIRTLTHDVDDYYRSVAAQHAKPDVLNALLEREGQRLVQKLSWPEKKPERLALPDLIVELSKRFGAVANVGNTNGVYGTIYGHRVLDEQRDVAQYGRSATLRFVQVDAMVSNGFMNWYYEDRGNGGWAADAIYQIRPMYVSGPLVAWMRTTVPDMRAQNDREIADETKRDEERIASDPNLLPHGVVLRMERQYEDKVLAALRASGLADEALRAAFIAKVTDDEFQSSIWAHEGRHAIDKKYDHITSSPDLEFTAKLSQVVFAPEPRSAVGGVDAQVPATSPHGRANRRIGEALTKWMREHADDIAGIDRSKPMLLQLDKLTDDQLRAAFRSMDPLARAAR